jgi:hypothetical protein
VTRHCTDRGGRGCPCPWHAKRRVYATTYARKRRGAKLDAKRMSARTCPRKFGREGVCGATLRSDIVGGRLVVTCPACERFARGICRDCPAPVAGQVRKARRCAACKARVAREATAKYTANNLAVVRKRARDSYRTDEEIRERRNEYKRAWRKAHPEKVKEQKRRESLKQSERVRAYHAAYREAHRTRIANYARKAYHGERPTRTCITRGCSIVLTHRKRKCTKCRERDRLEAQRLLATRHPRRAA